MNVNLRITNCKTGLTKMINANEYTHLDLEKTFKAYESLGNFIVKIIRSV